MDVVAAQMLYIRAIESLRSFRDDEEGQGLVEYALILVLVSIVVITTLGLIGTGVDKVFKEIGDKLAPVVP